MTGKPTHSCLLILTSFGGRIMPNCRYFIVLNDKADYVSHIQDFDDWKTNPQLFANIDQLWGPHNAQLPIFYSRFWCPGSAAVDAFTVNWSGNVNWLIPPFYLISHTVKHATGIRGRWQPVWTSAHFWPVSSSTLRSPVYIFPVSDSPVEAEVTLEDLWPMTLLLCVYG